MSHFAVGVIIPKGQEEVKESVIDELLAPYSESIEVAPYVEMDREKAKASLQEKIKEYEAYFSLPKSKTKDINMDYIENEYVRLNLISDEEWFEEESKYWEPKEKKQGFRLSTYNPSSKWDWYEIGGRWTGLFTGYDPTKDPQNYEICWLCNGTGLRNDELGKKARLENPKYTCNGCQGTGKQLKYHFPNIGNETYTRNLLKDKKIHPFAVVTPDGVWHQEAEMGWWGMTSKPNVNWEKEKKKLFSQYADHLIVVVDCHI